MVRQETPKALITSRWNEHYKNTFKIKGLCSELMRRVRRVVLLSLFTFVFFQGVGVAHAITLQEAYADHKSDVQVNGSGTVVRVLRDDNKGSRHQKFILKLSSGQTILIAHNIDLAPRIKTIAQGDTVQFYGEYEYSSKGGVVHWTHRDPNNRHVHGWLKHQGTLYQ